VAYLLTASMKQGAEFYMHVDEVSANLDGWRGKRLQVHGNVVKPRWVTTLALSFDHRVADGEQGSRFLADVAAIVHDPGNSLLY